MVDRLCIRYSIVPSFTRRQFIDHAAASIRNLNFFRQEEAISTRPDRHQIALQSTRVYITIMSITMALFTAMNSLQTDTVSMTEKSPSISTFEHLRSAYRTTLNCYCKETNIEFDRFMQLTPSFHQVRCTRQRQTAIAFDRHASSLVSDMWK
jgi:hypothetical protein